MCRLFSQAISPREHGYAGGMTDQLDLPDGSVYTVVERPEDQSGGPLVMEFVLAPGASAPPPHFHPNGQVESFGVTAGWFELLVDKEWQRIDAGETVDVPPGTRHTFRNESGAETRVRNVHSPAHDFEEYIRGIHAIATVHGATGPTNPVTAAKYARLIKQHDSTIVLSDLPARMGVTALAGLAKLLRLELPAATR